MNKARVKSSYLAIRKNLLRPLALLKNPPSFLTKEVKRILFLRFDRIGDMVLSTAALQSLRQAFPKAHIAVLASVRNHQILQHNPSVDEVLIYKGILRFIRELRPKRYDLVIDPFLTYELKQAFIAYLTGGKYRIGFEEAGREIFFNLKGPEVSTQKRMVEHLFDLVEYVGGSRERCRPKIFISDAERKWALDMLSSSGIKEDKVTVALHPGAFYPSQKWPVERFGALAKRIREGYEAQIVLFGTRDEEALFKEISDQIGKDVHIFSGLSLREFMALVSRCDLLVCNNSGPLHIASALNLPTVSMIGPTITPLWLPSGERDMVINKGLSCSPCNKAVCKEHECMELITVDEVFEAVKSQINRMRSKQKGSNTAQERVRNS